MKWKRVYVEITNQCNLHCDFCIHNQREPRFMSVAEFAHVGVGGVRLEVRVVEEVGEVIERIAFGHGSLQSTKRYVNAVTL